MTLDPRAYRDIWGNFATGVTVITTDVGGWLHGMTANGVASVALDPLLMLAIEAIETVDERHETANSRSAVALDEWEPLIAQA